jgi:hypothetical protein
LTHSRAHIFLVDHHPALVFMSGMSPIRILDVPSYPSYPLVGCLGEVQRRRVLSLPLCDRVPLSIWLMPGICVVPCPRILRWFLRDGLYRLRVKINSTSPLSNRNWRTSHWVGNHSALKECNSGGLVRGMGTGRSSASRRSIRTLGLPVLGVDVSCRESFGSSRSVICGW